MEYNVTYRQKDKGWQVIVSYKVENSKWKQKSKQGFSKKSEAKNYSEQIIEELKATESLRTPKEFENITFEEFTSLHMKHLKLTLAQNTICSYESALLKFKDLNTMKLTDIKPMHIQNIVDSLISSYSIGTIKTYTQKLKAMFNSAVSQYSILLASPAQNIKYKSVNEPTCRKALSTKELDDLLYNMKSKNLKYYAITLLASKCGLRIGEIIGLTWNDIDTKNNTISVSKQWKLIAPDTFGFGSTKSKNSNRIVPLPSIVKETLSRIKVRHIDGRIFKYTSPHSIGTNLTKIYASVGYNISVHELRHTYATTLVSLGIDFKTIALLMGHDIEQTLKTYSHVTNEMLEKASTLIKASL